MTALTATEEREIAVAELRDSMAHLRLSDPASDRDMRESLSRYGQLMPVAGQHERSGAAPVDLLDGFKRLRAARELCWTTLRVRLLPLTGAEAKAAIGVLNHARGLSELEEAWLVRSLYRDDGLTQLQIGHLLRRHKSWVSRRLLLAEGLDQAVQADVRLGLLAATAATALARLPRRNQLTAARAVVQQGLTRHQVERVVSEVLARPEGERDTAVVEIFRRVPQDVPANGRSRLPERTPAEWITADVAQLSRTCGRLQARLLERPLVAFGSPAADIIRDGLLGLLPVLAALVRTIERSTARDHHVPVPLA